MSNDNKTLADVQPGGRVRLGDGREPMLESMWVEIRREGDRTFPRVMTKDQAEAFLRTCNVGPLPTTHPLYTALSAQPSPGGQGDSLCSELLARADCLDSGAAGDREAGESIQQAIESGEGYTPDDATDVAFGLMHSADSAEDTAVLLRKAAAALAARQPVGEPPMEMRICELRHVSLKPNRPYIFTVDANCANCRADAAYAMGQTDIRPAQAVDLDAMRALLQRRIEQWRSHLPADPGAPGTREIETKGEHDYNNDVRIYREGIAVMEEVLSKIDSQAVGNG